MKNLLLLKVFILFSLTLSIAGDHHFKNYDYSQIDAWVKSCNMPNSTPEEVVQYLLVKTSNEQEKVRAIYLWISTNIQYDYSYSNYYAKETFADRSGVCNGFATLFQEMALLAGLNARVVSGYAKGAGYSQGKPRPESNHAWNAVKLDGAWYNIECTWASCINQFDYYFLTPPEQFIFSHLPLDESYNQVTKSWDYSMNFEHQLLPNPVSYPVWDQLPDVYAKDMIQYPEYYTLEHFRDGHPDSFSAGNYPSDYGQRNKQVKVVKRQVSDFSVTVQHDVVQDKPLLNEESIAFLKSFNQFLKSPEFEAMTDKLGVELNEVYVWFKGYYDSGKMEADVSQTMEDVQEWWDSDAVQHIKSQSKSVIKSGLNYLMEMMEE